MTENPGEEVIIYYLRKLGQVMPVAFFIINWAGVNLYLASTAPEINYTFSF